MKESFKKLVESIAECMPLIIVLTFILLIAAIFFVGAKEIVCSQTVDIKEWISDGELHKVSCTAYVDDQTSTGKKPVEGLTLAGPVEWIGCTCVLYDENMCFLGFYEFTDVGYGKETNQGSSKLKDGKNLGTIEIGEWIDMYFDSEEAMEEWGKRTVYIQLIESVG